MINERDIEILLANHIQEYLPEYEVEAYSTDVVEAATRAKRHLKGLIAISHTNSPARYEQYDQAGIVDALTAGYVATILVNDRQNREELYNVFHTVRKAMKLFRADGIQVRLSRHAISTHKFPDIQEGVHFAEVEIEVTQLYYEEEE